MIILKNLGQCPNFTTCAKYLTWNFVVKIVFAISYIPVYNTCTLL